MRKIILASFAVLALSVGPAGLTHTAHAELFSNDHPGSFADLAEKLLPAVVNISSTQKMEEPQNYPDMPQFPPGSPFEDFFEQFMGPRGQGAMPLVPPASLGSGFVIDAEKGYVITNNHVIKDADEVRVTFYDDETFEAEVIGRDEKTDIAVLKVETDKKLTAVKFGNSDPLRVGDWVLAIGNPFGLGGTVTAGIVSARQRDISAGPYDDFIQTDASINRGNSGGPMFNLEGEVIGINTAIFSPTGGSVGIGFAIPSALAEPVIKQIIQYGRTRRGWLGVRIQSVTDEIAESLGLDKARGALVASVTTDGPAAKSGIEAGDVILSFNGTTIDEMRTLPRTVAETPIDSEANVVVWRGNQKKAIRVKVGELEKAEEDGVLASASDSPAAETKGTKIDPVGLTVKELSGALRQDYDISNEVNGVLIDEIERNSEAARKGLMAGDVIVEIDQKPVTKPADIQALVDDAVKKQRSSTLLLINREGDVRFVALKLAKKDNKNGE
ncbi:MAG: DegQ family serine endoprotease [Alphaproteobacteria bacterium]|nr:DegQ family serine endoprotease [Alphaproteobacteria bacterium]